MATEGDPFQVKAATKQAMKQAYGAADQHFEFLKKNLGLIPTGGTEVGEKLKSYAEKNITSIQGFLKSLSEVNDFQQAMRIQTEFMHSQLNAYREQTKSLAEAYTKSQIDARNKHA